MRLANCTSSSKRIKFGDSSNVNIYLKNMISYIDSQFHLQENFSSVLSFNKEPKLSIVPKYLPFDINYITCLCVKEHKKLTSKLEQIPNGRTEFHFVD